MTPEWRLLDPRIDLEALGLYLDTVEQQLAFLRDQWQARLNTDLNGAIDSEDRRLLMFEHDIREAQVTRSLRGGFIISLWASYESGVLEVANFIKYKKDKWGLLPKFPHGKGDNLVDRARSYFDSVLEFHLHPDLDNWHPLYVLYAVRNTYAHTNGRLRLMRKPVRETLKPVIDASVGITYEEDGLRVDGPYAHSSYRFVEHLLRDLISRALKWADGD